MKLGNLDLKKFVEESHGLAMAKGWHDKPRSDSECIMLMVSEVAEATEEVRAARPYIHYGILPKNVSMGFQWVEIGKDIVLTMPWEGGKQTKPKGELIEFADCAIRIADFFGMKQKTDQRWDLSVMVGAEQLVAEGSPYFDRYKLKTPLEQHLDIVYTLARANNNEMASRLAAALIKLHYLTEWRSYDLAEMVRVKHEYNKTRGYRHGGKAL
jgi:hypothetical protein